RQVDHRHPAGQRDDDGQHPGEDRPLDEEVREHVRSRQGSEDRGQRTEDSERRPPPFSDHLPPTSMFCPLSPGSCSLSTRARDDFGGLGGSCFLTSTAWLGRTRCMPTTITCSPFFSPLRMTRSPSTACPSSTSRRSTSLLSLTT